MANALITRRSGGGLTGSTLTVTAADEGIITMIQQGTAKQRQKEVTALGNYTAVFNGLSAGVWEVTHSAYPELLKEVTIGESIVISTFVAWIEVTYPSGSICTCTLFDADTGKEFKADMIEQLDGYYKFEVHQEGAWRVYCSTNDGSKSIEEVVPVTDGKTSTVNLSYTLMLFEANKQHEDITGGWSYSGYAIPNGYYSSTYHSVDASDTLYAAAINNGYAQESNIIGTVNKVPLKNYNMLTCEVNLGQNGTSNSNYQYGECYIAISKTKSFNPSSESTVALQEITSSGRQSFDLSLANCNSSEGYYIVIAALNNQDENLLGGGEQKISNASYITLSVYSMKATV
jgi:hypothetical protein